MATWVAHFRLAEQLLVSHPDLDRQAFLVGNIAPDSGLLNADKTGYEPPSDISHWRDGADIQPEQFYADHLADKTFGDTEYAFRLGYYCHLIADRVWEETVWRPKKITPLYAEPLAKDPQFVGEIKKDWYGLDFLYLQETPQSIFYTDFVGIKDVPDYIDNVFPAGAFTQRVKDTQEFYLYAPARSLDRPYIYLNRQEWEAYIAHAVLVLKDELAKKRIHHS